MLLTAVLAATVLAQSPATGADDPPTLNLSKKEVYLATKKFLAAPDRRADRRAREPIWAHNLRTHEIMPLSDVRGLQPGAYDEFFKCWFTREHGDVPDALVDQIIATARHFEVREVRVISGFRHPKYNLSLRKKGREVARKSQHTQANAIDFFLPGVATKKLYDHLLEVHPGGVGYYPVSEFVHIDLGKKRTWRGT